MTDDVRWIQRFNNFQKSLIQLDKAMGLIEERDLSELEQQGVIQAFEYNYELAWNVIKDFYEYQGEQNIQGSRDAFKMAFRRGLISNGDVWMKMIKSRSLTSHTYNEETMVEILDDVIKLFYIEFTTLKESLRRYIDNSNV
ncbi:MAG: nucleotidyltransferase [Methylomarinum sp.]|nr:nucleotidyltransferase [Methylomarinum sp.]